MPYERLPARLRQLIPDDKGQEIFMGAFNSQMESGRSESVSFATAWGKLKDAGYKRDPKSGVWSKGMEKSSDTAIRNKLDEWNEKYADEHGKITMGMLRDVYDRGIGAYRTNPESVRPNVKSPERWAMARLNSFLSAARGSKKINHDQDIHDKIKKSQPTVSDVHVPSTGRKEIDKEDTFKPPAGARAAARRALRWREKYPDEAKGGTRVGWERANQLASGENLSRETVARMASFFARHEGNEEVPAENKEKPWRDRGRLMHDAWGGDTGASWSRRIMDSLEKSESPPVKEGLLEKAISAIIDAVMPQADVNKSVEDAEILKLDDEQRIVYGWASVVTEDGEPVVDTQGDVISPSEMEKMANDFMLDVRKAKAMHTGGQVGEVIHSMPLTNELMKAFDIYSDREGWLVAFKIYDDDAWEKVRNGEFQALSIGGKAGSREAIE